MKKFILKLIITFIPALAITVFLYWPVYQRVPLTNRTLNLNAEVNKLKLDIDEDIKEILVNSIQLPFARHELCLKNRNGFHFIHADSNMSGVPFFFYTDDLNQNDYGRKYQLGAMAISFYYTDGTSDSLLYREFKAPIKCETLSLSQLNKYASSTIEYRYANLDTFNELDIGDKGKITMVRPIVGGFFIDSSKTFLIIIARWKFFVITFLILFLVIRKLVNLVSKQSDSLAKKFTGWLNNKFKKHDQL